MTFDKLAFVKRLEKDGMFTRDQAETLAEGLNQVASGELATKADLKAAEQTLNRNQARLGLCPSLACWTLTYRSKEASTSFLKKRSKKSFLLWP